MNKAFIFDMDGVIVDSENAWEKYAKGFFEQLVGSEIAEKVGDLIGMTVNEAYEKSVHYGLSMDKDIFVKAFDEKAAHVYSKASIAPGVSALVERLIKLGFKLGIVSSSRQNWIQHVLPRLSFRDKLEYVVSINDRSDLRPKPDPDAYLEAIKELRGNPQTTIILEDSNRGIQAARATGAYVIGFRQNLVPGYQQRGAHVCADKMEDVIKLVEARCHG